MKRILKGLFLLFFLLLTGCSKEPRDYEYKLQRQGWLTEIASKDDIAQILSKTPEYVNEVDTAIVASKQSSNIGFIFFFKSKDQAKKYYDLKKTIAEENEVQHLDKNIVFISYGTEFLTDLGL